MKYIVLAIMVGLIASVGLAQTKDDGAEVVYFHGKRRCATCVAIEKHTREVVRTDFATEVKKGEVRLRVVDLSTDEGAKLARIYKVSWSSLYVNRWKNGKETRNDMTRFGFLNARSKPEEFKKGLKVKISELIK